MNEKEEKEKVDKWSDIVATFLNHSVMTDLPGYIISDKDRIDSLLGDTLTRVAEKLEKRWSLSWEDRKWKRKKSDDSSKKALKQLMEKRKQDRDK